MGLRYPFKKLTGWMAFTQGAAEGVRRGEVLLFTFIGLSFAWANAFLPSLGGLQTR